jgi:hypothetical protein
MVNSALEYRKSRKGPESVPGHGGLMSAVLGRPVEVFEHVDAAPAPLKGVVLWIMPRLPGEPACRIF